MLRGTDQPLAPAAAAGGPRAGCGAARHQGPDAGRRRRRWAARARGRLPARRRAMPRLRGGDPLARAGRCQPGNLLVSALPALMDNRDVAVTEESAIELLRRVP